MSAVTSKLNQISIGEGKNKKTIFTGTTITPTTNADGNKTYKVEIVQYDNAKGEGGRVIGERLPNTPNIVKWNDNASDDIFLNPKAQNSIKSASKTQANSIEEQLVTNSAESRAYNQSNGSANKGNEADNSQDEARASKENAAAVNSLICLLALLAPALNIC